MDHDVDTAERVSNRLRVVEVCSDRFEAMRFGLLA